LVCKTEFVVFMAMKILVAVCNAVLVISQDTNFSEDLSASIFRVKCAVPRRGPWRRRGGTRITPLSYVLVTDEWRECVSESLFSRNR